MRVFSISDLHLSMDGKKPMDCFGPHWLRHWETVERHWRAAVEEDDLVLLPGDHSWAMRLDEADRDLGFIASLPGTKVLTRGNHDYWWQSLKKIRRRFPQLHFLQNDAAAFGSVGVCGTRGWDLPGPDGFDDEHDEKIYQREIQRLDMSVQALPPGVACRIAMIHYPPLTRNSLDTEFTRILERGQVDFCVYGHLHLGHGHRPVQGIQRGVDYRLVACDSLGFRPLELAAFGPTGERAPDTGTAGEPSQGAP